MPIMSDVLKVRVLVGYLGESHRSNWWPSLFFDRTSEPFLAPTFAHTAGNARVVGVTEAARRVHDDAIGVGRAFHLFRLPETHEQNLHRALATSQQIAVIESAEIALEQLQTLSSDNVEVKIGPVHVGPLNMLADAEWVPAVAGHYYAAFTAGVPSFPYFAG